MLSKLLIQQVVDSQKERTEKMDPGLDRQVRHEGLTTHALIITGIRRCSKSTVLQQINREFAGETIFVNFEDPRLTGFDVTDLNRLHEIGVSRSVKAYFFDEIQNVAGWEKFVRFRLDEGYRIFISGPNASMLSRELGTKLTGRHITRELFPFSYPEYLEFTRQERNAGSYGGYLRSGGFPEYVKTALPEVLMQAFSDILIRDIAVRHGLKNVNTLQITAGSLKTLFF